MTLTSTAAVQVSCLQATCPTQSTHHCLPPLAICVGMAMLLAIVVFVMGSSVYVHVLPTESPMVRVVKVVYAAMQNR